MNEIKSSSIEVEPIKVIDQEKISESNELKWKSISKKFSHIYEEAKTKTQFSNVIDTSPYVLFKLIIDFYYDSKTLDRSTKKTLESVKGLLETLEWGTEEFDKREFLAKLDATLDYIYGHEEIEQ